MRSRQPPPSREMPSPDLTDEELDRLVLTEFPYPLAINYRRMLERTDGWEIRTRRCGDLFEYTLRTVVLCALSQYLVLDQGKCSYAPLDKKLGAKLDEAFLSDWNELLWLTLKAYRDRRETFFIPELYDLFWDTSTRHPKQRSDARWEFDRLVRLRNRSAHGLTNAEGWHDRGEEVLGLLRAVLKKLSFLREYALIRITARQGDEYEYRTYTGQAVELRRGPWPGSGELRLGWFYLARRDGALLPLHPLFIPWAGDAPAAFSEIRSTDAAVYEDLAPPDVGYTALLEYNTVSIEDMELLEAIEGLTAHLKLRPRKALPNWTGLRYAAGQLTQEARRTAGKWHRPTLYLQRDATLAAFREFLASDKSCFVLVGQSGAGKSSFVFSQASELADREEIALLVISAHSQAIPEESSVEQALGLKLGTHVALREGLEAAWLSELHVREQMSGRKVIVVLDAINLHANAVNLLRKIDQMVASAAKYPWLKMVVTCRAQVWRALRLGLQAEGHVLAEPCYYHGPSASERDELAVRLEPFRQEELEEVYEKYRAESSLLPAYTALKPATRNALRDPFALRLVADAAHTQPMPERIQVSDICGIYVEAMRTEGFLRDADLDFLQQQLMPLMLSEGHYANEITRAQLRAARTPHGASLQQLIHDDSRLGTDDSAQGTDDSAQGTDDSAQGTDDSAQGTDDSAQGTDDSPQGTGEPFNASFVRLVDAGILAERDPGRRYTIIFPYERFYDYFAGERLAEIICGRGQQKEAAFTELIELTRAKPFLWGPVMTALGKELAEGDTELLVALSRTSSQRVKEIVTATLIEYGRDHAETAKAILDSLRHTGQAVEQSPRRAVLRRGAKGPTELSKDDRTARRIAIEVASALAMPEILLEAACDPDAGVRAVATQYTYHLWTRDHAMAYELLRELSQRIRRWWIVPDMAIFESCLGISSLILFDDSTEPVRGVLQSVWRDILDRLLLVPRQKGTLYDRAARRLRRLLLSLVIRYFTWMARNVESELKDQALFSVRDLDLFFKDRALKERFGALIPYLDPRTTHIQLAEADLLEAAKGRDLLTAGLVLMVLIAQIFGKREPTLPILEKLLDVSLASTPPTPTIVAVLNALADVVMHGRICDDDEVFAGFETALSRFFGEARCQGKCASHAFLWSKEATYLYAVSLRTEQTDPSKIPIVCHFIETALREKRSALIKQFVSRLGSGALETGKVAPFLPTLVRLLKPEEIAPGVDPTIAEETRGLAASCLARLEIYHPDEVASALAGSGISDSLQRQVLASEPAESLSDLYANGLTRFVGIYFVRGEDSFLRGRLQAMLRAATESTSLKQWLKALVESVAGLVYGEGLF